MTHKRPLDHRAIRHLRDITEREIPFNKLLKDLPLERGHVFGYFPETQAIGDLKSSLRNTAEQILDPEYIRATEAFVSGYLKDHTNGIAVFARGFIPPAHKGRIVPDGLSYFVLTTPQGSDQPNRQDVFLFADSAHSSSETVSRTMREATGFPTLGILTKTNSSTSLNSCEIIDQILFKDLIESTDYLLFSGHDGEVLLIWAADRE